MGVSPAIFESAAQRTEHFIPGVYSREDNISSSSGVSAGNFCILGTSNGGEPLKLLSFNNLSEAKNSLVGGDLLKGVAFAFEGSNVYTPQRVFAMRVNTGTRSERTLKSNDTDILKVKAWDWGVHTNQLKMWLKNGTIENSKSVTVVYKDKTETADNIIKPSFSVIYTGEGENPTISITKTGISLAATVDGEAADTVDFTFEDCATIDEVVTRINDSQVYVAMALDVTTDAPSSELDTVAGKDITDETILYSNLQALIDALDSISFIGEVELNESGSRNMPDNDDGFVYFTEGTAGTNKWNDALEALEKENIQIIAATTTDKTILSAISSHCTKMSSTVNRKERTAILGGSIGETDEVALTTARGLNSILISYVADSVTKVNPLTNKSEVISGAIVGCMLGGMESAMAVNEPLTFKAMNILGVSVIRTNSNMEKLIKGGILVVNPNPDNSNEYVVIRAVTTFQGNNDLISCERSMVREALYMNRDLRNAYSTGVGHINIPSVSAVVQTLKDCAKEWAISNYIIPDGIQNVWGIKVKINGDKVYLTYSRYLMAPRNFVFVTASNHVYESTVEL